MVDFEVVSSVLVFVVGRVVKSGFRGLVDRAVLEVVGEIRGNFFEFEVSRLKEHFIFRSKTFSITVCSGTKAFKSSNLKKTYDSEY